MQTTSTDLPVDDRLKTKEVARLVQMDFRTLARGARSGRYKGVMKLGRDYRWPRSLVREMLGLPPEPATAGSK